MKRNWVVSVNFIFCIMLKDTLSQYANPDISVMQQFQYNPYKNPVNPFQQYPNPVWNIQDNVNYEEYDDYDEENTCNLPCESCDDLHPTCRNMCPNCAPTPSSLPNPGYFFLPFQYPYPMTTITTTTTTKPLKKSRTTTVTTPISTTTEATTQKPTTEIRIMVDEQTSATTDKLEESKVENVITKSLQVKDKSPYMLTSLRRTKPNWIPKYGIVPISNKFAEKLMLQMRSMKVLHPRQDNLRDVDEIPSVN